MNRRHFLQSLLALGGSLSLQIKCNASEIDKAWSALQQSPVTFYVREFGTLTTDPCYEVFPASRAEFYEISAPQTLAEAQHLAETNHMARGVLEGALQDAGVENLADLDEESADEVIWQLVNWVDDAPDPSDDEGLQFYAQHGQSYALSFFQAESAYCAALNIAIIEGDCPGSSYFAAELRMPIDEANSLAEDLGLPIRFAYLGF